MSLILAARASGVKSHSFHYMLLLKRFFLEMDFDLECAISFFELSLRLGAVIVGTGKSFPTSHFRIPSGLIIHTTFQIFSFSFFFGDVGLVLRVSSYLSFAEHKFENQFCAFWFKC